MSRGKTKTHEVDTNYISIYISHHSKISKHIMDIIKGPILVPTEKGFDCVRDGVVVINDKGEVMYSGSIKDIRRTLKNDVLGQVNDLCVVTPGTVNAHNHIFQPPAIPGPLIKHDTETGENSGWLPETLKFESMVKSNPEMARRIAATKFESYKRNGIIGSIEYTTSSVEATRIVLSVAEEMGFKDTVKVGYVCMDQNVGNGLESSSDEAISATRSLLKEFGDRVVVIDRFPIAVSSPLRKRLALLASEFGVPYETHSNESVGEKALHEKNYDGKSILSVLLEDGVFKPGSKVGLAHTIHATEDEIRIVGEKISDGCTVYIRACPSSNAQLGSYVDEDGQHVEFPLKAWEEAGAIITFGLDNGAGRGFNLFAEALDERGRPHTDRYVPSYVDLLRYATTNGSRTVGLDPKNFLAHGHPATFVAVSPAGLGAYLSPDDVTRETVERIAGLVIEGGQDPYNIKTMYVRGKKLTGK